MTDTTHDVVVVGGGPVGLVTAIHGSAAGLRVAVVEPRVDPVDKACGEGLMWSAVQHLAMLGVSPAGRDFGGITYLDAGGQTTASASFADRPGRGVRRVALHEAIASRAKELDVERVQSKVVGLRQDGDHVEVRLRDGSPLIARYVVGADGLHSFARNTVGLRARSGRSARFGFRQHYRVEPWSSHVEVYWAAGAEAYVTPVADDVVGVAILGERNGQSFSERMLAFPALCEKVTAVPTLGAVAGAGPLRQRVPGRVRGRVLLVGDAAGYVDALTGEGLAIGFVTAHAAISAISAGRPADYAAAWPALTREYRWLTQSLILATRSPVARRAMLKGASTFPRVFTSAVNRLA